MTWRKKYGTTHFQQHPKLSRLWRLMFIFAIFEIQISGDGLSRFMKLFTDTAVCQGDDEFSFRFAKKGFSIWRLVYKAATASLARQEISKRWLFHSVLNSNSFTSQILFHHLEYVRKRLEIVLDLHDFKALSPTLFQDYYVFC